MISLEQIRLLEGKITRAIELIRVLKDENATLRRGLDSAQKRMKELEALVDGFKADQKEIESVIVRTLRHLDDMEEGSGAAVRVAAAPPAPPPRAAVAPLEGTEKRAEAPAAALPEEPEKRAEAPTKEELDIF